MPRILFILLLVLGCSTPKVQKSREVTEKIIDHKYFSIVYDTRLRIAKYVSYTLSAEDLQKNSGKRKDRFRADPYLTKNGLPAVKPNEYRNSGYDKGHLAPSADFAWSAEANDLTFVMSNMVPQKPGLNRDSWRRLEEKVRRWACGEKKVSVITGPVIVDGLPRLKSGLVVPHDFFKIIIDETPPRKVLTFIYNQNDQGDVIGRRIASLDKIRSLTNLEFGEFFHSFDEKEKRAPAAVEKWKEADCRKKID